MACWYFSRNVVRAGSSPWPSLSSSNNSSGAGNAGSAVTNLAARLCAEAAGGEVLVSQRVVAALPPGFLAEPRGELQLKGFQRPVPVQCVRSEPGPG